MKPFLFAIFLTWGVMFAGDYFAIRRHGDAALCHKIVTFPIWYHLIFPGAGNACIDLGFFQ